MTASALRRDFSRVLDRLIVADALVAATSLLTKDRAIHDHTTIATW
jgi:PIN domain nuclease of toxin-antitoxin system